MSTPIETTYPISFRASDAKLLGDHLRHNNSVNLIGMKRVGINNFLRFFLFHPEVQNAYLSPEKNHLFIHIDLNDLIERDMYPFWVLTLKRIVDVISGFNEHAELKEESKKLFTESIQLKDLFYTVDSVRKIISLLVEDGYYLTLIFNRFDRMCDAATPEFFGNLQSLKDHAQRNLSFIFTSYRPLYELKPDVFSKQALSVFCNDMFLKPAELPDADTILHTLEDRYQLQIPIASRKLVLEMCGGHAQYLHLSVIKLRDTNDIPNDKETLFELIKSNEEANLLSEELFESLTKKEQEALLAGDPLVAESNYLSSTGIINTDGSVFNPLFQSYIEKRGGQKQNGQVVTDFTKKEHLLFTYLQSHEGELCEREAIIEAVWPDYAESGVSDWAIDRLVARVRVKLKNQNSQFELVTVITRGYKLIKK